MKKLLRKIVASSLALICTVTAGITLLVMGGVFTAHDENVNHNNQTVIGNFFGNGITLTASAAESSPVTLTHGNDYNTAWVDSLKRACIQPYGIEIPASVKLTAKTGFLFGFYRVSDVSNPTGASMLSSNWVATFTTTSAGIYGIAIKKEDDSDFDFSKDSIYIADYIESTDSSIFGSSNSGETEEPSTPVPAGAQRLTATITPSDATNQKVDWSVSWVNPSSTWASGKTVTDYVTVTPTEDGALTADVECLQAFGEQILVTVKARIDSNISATCTVDYAKRVTKVNYRISAGGSRNYTTDDESIMLYCNFSDNIQCKESHVDSFEYSIGTLDDEFSFNASFHGVVTDELLSAMSNETGYSITLDDGLYPNDSYGHNLSVAISVSLFFRYDKYLASSRPKAVAAMELYVANHPETMFFTLKIRAKGTYSTFEKDFPVYFNAESLLVAVEGIELDKTGIVF